jgi:N-acyl-D-amino-acid deacylase
MELQDLPLSERMARLRDPEVRARLLAEEPSADNPLSALLTFPLDRVFPLGDPPDYEPAPEQSIAARAARAGREPKEMVYDLMLEDDGRELLMWAVLNYAGGDSEPVREMLLHPASVLGGSDGGAHCGAICDASTPTSMLTHWARDRTRGERLPLPFVVKKQSADTARSFGLIDRGVVQPGFKADVNLIDDANLTLGRPEMAYDLPGGARRFTQRARGYVATIVSGEIVLEHDEETGARPGRLVRRGADRD